MGRSIQGQQANHYPGRGLGYRLRFWGARRDMDAVEIGSFLFLGLGLGGLGHGR